MPPTSTRRAWSAARSARSSKSRHPDFRAGDIVVGTRLAELRRPNGADVMKIDPAAPISTALGVLGMPGMTAYVGLLEIGKPKAGRDGRVSAARARSVGGRSARQDQGLPCRRHRRRQGEVRLRRQGARLRRLRRLQAAGANLRALRRRARTASTSISRTSAARCSPPSCSAHQPFARMPVCGMISQYNATEQPGPGPDWRAAAGQARRGHGLHRLRISTGCRLLEGRAAGEATARSSTAKISSRASRTRPRRSSACSGEELRQAAGPGVGRPDAALAVVLPP